MISAKNKQIQLDVVVLSKAQNLSVSLTIPFWASGDALASLCSTGSCEINQHKGTIEAALAFALYTTIKEKMIGSPLEAARSKTDHVSCAVHNNNFVISWNTQGTGSALKKTIGVALKCLQPNSLFSKYSYGMKLLGCKIDRKVFNDVANKMIDSLNKHIHFVAIGKIKADIKDILHKVSTKYVASKKTTASKCAPPDKYPDNLQKYPQINCVDGAAAICVADYIRHQGFPVRICDKKITIYSNQWDSKRKVLSDKNRITAYVNTKYNKLDELSGLYLAYISNSEALGSGHSIIKLTQIKDPSMIIIKNINN